MAGSRMRPAMLIAGLLLGLLAVTLQGVQGEELENVPSEDQCRPYIEKALKDLGTEGSDEQSSVEDAEAAGDNHDEEPNEESATDSNDYDDKSGSREKRDVSAIEEDDTSVDDGNEGDDKSEETDNEVGQDQEETAEVTSEEEDNVQESEGGEESQEKEDADESNVDAADESGEDKSNVEDDAAVEETSDENKEETSDQSNSNEVNVSEDKEAQSNEQDTGEAEGDTTNEEAEKSIEDVSGGDSKQENESVEKETEESSKEGEKSDESKDSTEGEKSEENKESTEEVEQKSVEEEIIVAEKADSFEQEPESTETKEEEKQSTEEEASGEKVESKESKEEGTEKSKESEEKEDGVSKEKSSNETEEQATQSSQEEESTPEEEELIMEIEIPEILRPRDHINQLLKLDEESEDNEKAIGQVSDVVLRDLKRLYDNAIKPLETLYKYRDLSNRHFGDPEIFSKPLVLFMGPWSGGKSSIINYLLDIEYKPTSLRTGAEPSPAYFNIIMHGEEEEVLDGTQLAADWTFSGLQKFGQGLLDRLKGLKLNSKLLEKVNIVEIPGILEIRKQVQRVFPFNDACQWFIDRADIIFLVYDPSKLDVGPETEAILDQLKGREYQTRIILNKADQVKPEELMRVQGALIWNISPLMSSAEPPIMYSASLWSIPYEAGAPTRLLYAQERAFLRDLRSAIDKRVEHKIASARRFAVRVRNHAKMVDCYLTTYYNHKSFFAKKKDISDRIIENPQDYHIYEGLSTLTNISRYDLPDPDVYRDFFRLNALYEFPLLSSTCTYFRGCPINRLDISIAYDLPELVGKYKKTIEANRHQQEEAVAAAVAAAEAAADAATPAPPAEQPKEEKKTNARSSASRLSMS